MGFTEFYWVLLGFTEFLEVSLGGRDIKRQRLAVDASFVGKNGFFFQLSIFFWLGTDRLWLERDGRRLSTVANGAVAFDAVAKLAPALVLLRRRPRTRGLCRDSFFSPSCTEFYRVLRTFPTTGRQKETWRQPWKPRTPEHHPTLPLPCPRKKKKFDEKKYIFPSFQVLIEPKLWNVSRDHTKRIQS